MGKCKICGSYNGILQLCAEDLEKEVQKGVILVYFCCSSTTPFCSSCKQMALILAPLVEEFRIARFDIAENQKTASKFAIHAAPTLTIFVNGKEVESFVGPQSTERLRKALKRHMEVISS